jgi:hypothetical protein
MIDQWYSKFGPEISEGLHDTDERTALEIIKAGFRHEPYDGLHLAGPDDDYLVQQHAKKNTERASQFRYAILRATFPSRSKEEGVLGPPCIRLYGQEIAEVSVIRLAICNTFDGKLAVSYDKDSLDELRD